VHNLVNGRGAVMGMHGELNRAL